MKRFLRPFLLGFGGGTLCMIAWHAAAQSAPIGTATSTGSAARGAALYEDKCGACHSINVNRIGPAHRGVFGRKAGSAAGFAYSPNLKKSKLIWNATMLDRWLTNSQATIPGSRMGFRLSDPGQRADVIAFLKLETGQKN